MSQALTNLVFEAARQSADRGLLPTTLGSAEIREQISEDLRVRSVFVSRAANVEFLSKVKEVVTAVAEGEMDQATARVTLLETLRALGYTPEGGFPDVDPGLVPPALKGTLQDLSSRRRLDLIIETQVDLMRGLGQRARGMTPQALRQYPAWELVRNLSAAVPRDWPARWVIAGGTLTDGGRMIALKGDPIWGELGSSGNFEDALDVDFPPFAFNSGMGWRAVSDAETSRLAITASTGETADEWISKEREVTGATQPLGEPVISVKNADPALLRKFERDTGVAVIDGQATTAAGREALRRKLEERRLAREARRGQLMEEALAK